MKTIVKVSTQLYRQLLKLYPPMFRADYGALMADTFQLMCAEAHRKQGNIGVLRLWLTVPGDLIPNAFAEHWLLHQQKGNLMSSLDLSFIIPAYNEELALAAVVQEAVLELPRRFANYEIIIINDGSTDRTAEIADQCAGAHPGNVRVIHQSNKGYKAALEAGVEVAKGACMMIMDPHQSFQLGFLNNSLRTS